MMTMVVLLSWFHFWEVVAPDLLLEKWAGTNTRVYGFSLRRTSANRFFFFQLSRITVKQRIWNVCAANWVIRQKSMAVLVPNLVHHFYRLLRMTILRVCKVFSDVVIEFTARARCNKSDEQRQQQEATKQKKSQTTETTSSRSRHRVRWKEVSDNHAVQCAHLNIEVSRCEGKRERKMGELEYVALIINDVEAMWKEYLKKSAERCNGSSARMMVVDDLASWEMRLWKSSYHSWRLRAS